MKRRKFLTIAGVGGAIVALASGKFLTTSFEDSAETLIRKELYFLTLDDGGVKEFAKQYSHIKSKDYKLAIRAYTLIGIKASQSGKIHQLVSNYLLSTDFFLHKMDESRKIAFVALYNPYMRPCAHPFSNAQYT